MASWLENTLFNFKELDGSKLSYRKKQTWDVLTQKKQIKPIKLQGVKLKEVSQSDWDDLGKLAKSNSAYFNVKDIDGSAYKLWEKLCSLYEKQSATSQVFYTQTSDGLQCARKKPKPCLCLLVKFGALGLSFAWITTFYLCVHSILSMLMQFECTDMCMHWNLSKKHTHMHALITN